MRPGGKSDIWGKDSSKAALLPGSVPVFVSVILSSVFPVLLEGSVDLIGVIYRGRWECLTADFSIFLAFVGINR